MLQLKALRKETGVSQQSVADYLGITRQAYSNYETGNRTPDTEALLKLAEFFNVSVDCLLRGNEKTPTPEGERRLQHAEQREILNESGMHILLDADAKEIPQEHLEEIIEFIKMKQRKYGR